MGKSTILLSVIYKGKHSELHRHMGNAVKVLGKPALCMEIKYRPWESSYCAHMGGLHGKHMELIPPSVN